jgi:lysocardiolipin and lysophospholipid acyltransferase
MRFFEFIFLSRKWAQDRKTIVDRLQISLADNMPLWLLVFPEGTVLSKNTRSISQHFADKMQISFPAKHLILPRSTGIYHILRCLEERADYLYDFTIGYSGIDGEAIPEDEFTPSKVFLEKKGPKSVHIHVDRIKIRDIPGFETKRKYNPSEVVDANFEMWLRERYLYKDSLLKRFFEDGSFPDNGQGVVQLLPVSPATQDWISIAALIVASLTSTTCFF